MYIEHAVFEHINSRLEMNRALMDSQSAAVNTGSNLCVIVDGREINLVRVAGAGVRRCPIISEIVRQWVGLGGAPGSRHGRKIAAAIAAIGAEGVGRR
jgi:hypothetical protein